MINEEEGGDAQQIQGLAPVLPIMGGHDSNRMAEHADEHEIHEPLDTILTLPSGMTVADIAASCRDAGVELINNSKHWGKAELAMWLSGTYALVTRHAAKEDATGTGTGAKGQVWPLPLLRDIDARLIERIMQSARTEILETLAGIARDGAASFVLRALITGSVVRCEDSNGEPAWAPTGEAARLADRVLSLFAVDYLVRPNDYETALLVCPQCSDITFDETAKNVGVCDRHETNQSVLAPRFTLPYPPLGA